MKISSLFTIILLTFVLSFLPNVIWAQHEADNWFFGNGVGLSFAMGRPTPIYGSPIHQIEGTAVISDPVTGNLLFYTDGVKAWNRMQQLLENGDGIATFCWRNLLGNTFFHLIWGIFHSPDPLEPLSN